MTLNAARKIEIAFDVVMIIVVLPFALVIQVFEWLIKLFALPLDGRNWLGQVLGNPELRDFYISWNTDDIELGRSYRIVCRDYGDDMMLLEDTIAELQHWFFRYNSEWPIPLEYKGRSHFTPPKRHEPSAGPIFEAMGIDKRLIGMEDSV